MLPSPAAQSQIDAWQYNKINVGTHKTSKYNDCINDQFRVASTARKSPRGPIKNVWYGHIETSKYLDDVYVEVVY